MRRAIFLLMVVGIVVQGGHEKYDGHQLFRVAGFSEKIASLDGRLDILSATPSAHSTSGYLEAVVRLSPDEREQWLKHFSDNDMPFTKIVDNLGDILRDEEAKIIKSRMALKRNGRSMSWDTYYTHDEINDYLDELAVKYPDLLTVVNAGLSYEGRQIKYVRISTTRFENPRKPVIVIDAATHAREWITPPVAMYVIEQLVNKVDEDMTDRLDWIIVPIVNPDGYEYSRIEDRLWRKTRSRAHENSDACPGVDGNRNYDFHFGTMASVANPCAITYEGPSPFSEPETRIIRNAVLQHLDRVFMYLSLHSHGNMFLYSWGNGTLSDNALFLHLAGVTMASKINSLALENSKPYIVGNAATVLYNTTGTSRDWTHAVGIPFTYTIELPGFGYEFVVPPEYIKQVVTETWAGIAEGGHFILSVI